MIHSIAHVAASRLRNIVPRFPSTEKFFVDTAETGSLKEVIPPASENPKRLGTAVDACGREVRKSLEQAYDKTSRVRSGSWA